MKRKRYKMFGFSLIEVVAALGVLAIGILSVLAAFSQSLRSTVSSARYTEAAMILQYAAEEERLKGYNVTQIGVPTPVAYTASQSNLRYNYQVRVINSSANNWVQKRITVFWGRTGVQESLSTDLFVMNF